MGRFVGLLGACLLVGLIVRRRFAEARMVSPTSSGPGFPPPSGTRARADARAVQRQPVARRARRPRGAVRRRPWNDGVADACRPVVEVPQPVQAVDDAIGVARIPSAARLADEGRLRSEFRVPAPNPRPVGQIPQRLRRRTYLVGRAHEHLHADESVMRVLLALDPGCPP